MSRDELKKAVKALLDEISPFDEPDEFIEGVDDESFARVKPIDSYIESELDNAARFCLESLPLSLLAEDVDNDTMCVHVDERGVGHIKDMYDYLRIERISCKPFERDITSIITSSSPLYLLQQNKHTRGGVAKPVACYTPERAEIEIFSFPKGGCCCHHDAKVDYIDCRVKAEEVMSNIEQFIVLRTAVSVLRILDDGNAAELLTAQYAEELTANTY